MSKEKGIKKKKWVRPKLMVLVRGKPGEGALSVLGNCKNGVSGAAYGAVDFGCRYGEHTSTYWWCGNCDYLTAS